MQIWFDMDGTIVDLYGVENWLPKLQNFDPSPYAEAKPLINMQALARTLNRLRRLGWEINIISWLAEGENEEYDRAVTEAKRKWLETHLASVEFTSVEIVKYGTPKEIGRSGILFDDDERNRTNWGENTFDQNNIIEILKGLK